jgi:hypothetical protein
LRCLKQSLAESGAGEGAADSDSLADRELIQQGRVDFLYEISSLLPLDVATHHDVDRHEAAGLSESLGNVVTLSERETASHRGTGAGCNGRVERINVERQVNGQVTVRVGVIESELHDFSDPVLVNVVHSEALDLVGAKNLLLGFIKVAEADVDAAGSASKKRKDATYICSGFRQGETHVLKGATSVPSRPRRNDTGQP